MTAEGGRGGIVPRAALAAAVTAALWIAVSASIGLPGMEMRAIERGRDALDSTASLKQAGVERWVAELRANAELIASYPSVVALTSGVGSVDERLGQIVESGRALHGWRAVRIVRADGRPADNMPPNTIVAAIGAEAASTGRTTVRFSITESGPVPLVASPVGTSAGEIGAVVIVDEPTAWLFPYLADEEIPTLTRESILVTREGDRVRFVSPARHGNSTKDSLSLPYTTPRLAESAALQGVAPTAEYIDYRGEPILAATRRISGSDVALVVKIDRNEALADYRVQKRARILALAGASAALLAIGLLMAGSVRSRERIKVLRSEARFAALFDQASDAILFVDAVDGTVIRANMAVKAMYGITPDDLASMPVGELGIEGLETLRQIDTQGVLDRGGSVSFETIHRRRDGSSIPVESSVRLIDLEGRPVIIEIVRDIRERKAHERRMHALVSSTPIGTFVGTPGGRVLDANEEFLRIIGRTREDLAGLHRWDEVTPPEWAAADAIASAEATETGSCRPYRKELIRPDGTRVPVIIGYTFIAESNTEVVAFVLDLTPQVQAENELKKLNEDLERRVSERTLDLERVNDALRDAMAEIEDLYENAPIAYHSLDQNGRYLRVNQTELAWLGYEKEELIGRSLLDMLTADEGVKREHLRQVVEEGGFSDLEVEILRKDGTPLPVVISAVARRDGEGRFLMTRSTMTDDSARRQLVNELRERNVELEAAIAEIESFSYTVSHDLRAPLRAIDGFARILAEEYAPQLDAEAKRLIGVIRNGATRMRNLIEALLRLSRSGREPIQKTSCDMTAIVRRTMEDQRVDGAEVHVAPLPKVRCDPRLMEQVWINLISNALKFTPSEHERRIEVDAREEPGRIVYRIRDNGVGFDMRHVDSLFGVFSRLHSPEKFPGSGVGLALVKQIVERHGGKVGAEGEPGRGATFWFALPK